MVTKTKKKSCFKDRCKSRKSRKSYKRDSSVRSETVIPLGALQSLVGLSETLKKMSPREIGRRPNHPDEFGHGLLFDSVGAGQGQPPMRPL